MGLTHGHEQGEPTMKVAITAKGEWSDSLVDQRFGRAKGFAIVDTESGRLTFVDNTQNFNAVQGAGIQAAATVAEHDVEYVLTGHCGPKAFRALTTAGIKVIVGAEGTVGSVLAQFKADELKAVEAADVEGHWV